MFLGCRLMLLKRKVFILLSMGMDVIIEVEQIVAINKLFKGQVLNLSNLEFDVHLAKEAKNIYRINAHLVRGIVTGHPFSDGNKRTAAYVVLMNFREAGMKCQRRSLARGIVSIARNHVHQINIIERRLRKWCTKN